jgi:outer membrane biosynthesis protein TonB
MKTLDAIKKLNAVKKEDGELLLATPIDMKVLKGAKEQDLAEAFMNAIESIPSEDEEKVPDELADVYNKLVEETEPEPKAEKEVAKPAAKAAKKSEVKETAKPAAKAAKEPDAKPETAKKETAKTDSKKPAAKAETKKAGVGVSCYGHKLGSSGALMDEAIKAGNSLEKIAKSCGVSLQRVKGHICHLAKEHNVKVKV